VAITGGDQGIGRGIAERLARDGAGVALCYRANKAGADEVVAGIEATGRKATAIQCDVGKISDGQRFIAEAAAQLGKIDILVNNAGLERHADFWDVTEADYDAVLNVNLKGVFFITQAFVRHRMAVKSGGKVINVSSVHEELPFPHFTSYCASKGGIKMMTRNLSIELAPLGITINNIAPGAIEQIRPGDEIASLIANNSGFHIPFGVRRAADANKKPTSLNRAPRRFCDFSTGLLRGISLR
jgi:glucose 1-dehydrogenase